MARCLYLISACLIGAATGVALGWLARKAASAYGDVPKFSVRRAAAASALYAVACLGIAARYGATPEAVEYALFAGILLVLALTDLDAWVIPNACIVAAILVRAGYIASGLVARRPDAGQIAVESLLSGLAVAAVLLVLVLAADRIVGRSNMGGGDLKLFFVAGLYFGWRQCLFLVAAACAIGLAGVGIAAALDKIRSRKTRRLKREEGHLVMPFGPSIALACWLTMLCGPELASWL